MKLFYIGGGFFTLLAMGTLASCESTSTVGECQVAVCSSVCDDDSEWCVYVYPPQSRGCPSSIECRSFTQPCERAVGERCECVPAELRAQCVDFDGVTVSLGSGR